LFKCSRLPVPCGHNFCKFCLERCLSEKTTCPICRTELAFINQQNLRVNIILADLLTKIFPKEHAERKAEVDEEIKEFRSTQVIRKKLYYGNLHRLQIPSHNSHSNDPNNGNNNWHVWKCFVRIENDTSAQVNTEYIKSVTFHLHPTFTPSVVVLNHPPFAIERTGWGWFNVKIVVSFQPKYQKPPLELFYPLCFEGNGNLLHVDIDFKVQVQSADQQGGAASSSSSSAAAAETVDIIDVDEAMTSSSNNNNNNNNTRGSPSRRRVTARSRLINNNNNDDDALPPPSDIVEIDDEPIQVSTINNNNNNNNNTTINSLNNDLFDSELSDTDYVEYNLNEGGDDENNGDEDADLLL